MRHLFKCAAACAVLSCTAARQPPPVSSAAPIGADAATGIGGAGEGGTAAAPANPDLYAPDSIDPDRIDSPCDPDEADAVGLGGSGTTGLDADLDDPRGSDPLGWTLLNEEAPLRSSADACPPLAETPGR